MTANTSIGDGANYAPESQARPVVGSGEFRFAAACLDHGHIYGQTAGLIAAGGTLAALFEPDATRRDAFLARFGDVPVARSYEEILDNKEVQLVASAAIPNRRGPLGLSALRAGKDYFSDKPPFTTAGQLKEARQCCAETGRRFWVYFAERVHNEAAWHAGELIERGAIGRVLHLTNLAPHRLSRATRPDWFFDKASYGGIITDLGSHQVEQFLTYAGCEAGAVTHARVANLNNPDHPELEDFGEFTIVGDNGASFFSRVDWFTPDGSAVWGDGRSFIVGTEGTLELRKYTDPNRQTPASLILLTDGSQIREIDCLGRVGFPFFGQLILDSLNGSELAMTQEHIFRAAELSLEAQRLADQGDGSDSEG